MPGEPAVDTTLTSCVSASPADAMLSDAITEALRVEPELRADLFGRLLAGIEQFMAQHPQERPWTFETFAGTDGSRIFRGGTGRSIVVDTAGRLWRARNYEDFDTAYDITESTCTIRSLTPRYELMTEYELRP